MYSFFVCKLRQMLLCNHLLRKFPSTSGLFKSCQFRTLSAIHLQNCISKSSKQLIACCRWETCYLLQSQSIMPKQTSRCISQSNNSRDLGRLLYIGQDKKKLKVMLGSFYSLSGIVTIASPYLLQIASTSVVATIMMAFHIFIFVIANPVGLYQFGKRYVHELYYNKETDTYTAILLSPTIINEKRLTFTPKDCTMPANPSVFTSFYVKKHPCFVNSDTMLYEDYMKMLRYASDFDYENPDRQEQYREKISEAVEKKKAEQA